MAKVDKLAKHLIENDIQSMHIWEASIKQKHVKYRKTGKSTHNQTNNIYLLTDEQQSSGKMSKDMMWPSTAS